MASRPSSVPDGPNGLIRSTCRRGHNVRVAFGPTPPRVAGRLLSALGLLGVALLLIVERTKTPRAT